MTRLLGRPTLLIVVAAIMAGCGSATEPADAPSPPPERPNAAAPQPGALPPQSPVSPAPSTVVDIPPASSSAGPEAETDEPAPADMAERPPCPAERNQTSAVIPERIKASHILIAYQGARRAQPGVTRSRQQARALARRVLERLCAGASFAEMVRQYSDEPGAAERAGSLGWFRHGVMVKRFADAAFALLPGELSAVVETEFGFHVIQRTE